MKKVLIVGATINGRNAVSSIFRTIIEQDQNECVFYCFGYEDGKDLQNDIGVIDFQVADPYKGFAYRLLRKTYYTFKIDDCKLTSKYALRQLNRICANQQFDLVIAAAGRFAFIHAGYLFAKRRGIPLRIVYFDPYTNNDYAWNVRLRKQLEQQYLQYVDLLLFNIENAAPVPEAYEKKLRGFKIPISKATSVANADNGKIVYGGTFYKKIRTPDGLIALAQKLSNSEYEIECYSNLGSCEKKPGISFYPLLSKDRWQTVSSQAAALVYIGNLNSKSKSSKYLEYVAMKKPIIGINVERDNEVRRYPFYIDSENVDALGILEGFRLANRRAFDPLKTFPDRSPRFLFEQMFLK